MSVLLDRELQIVNCHASTETSDLLGGLRPLRGRKLIFTNLVNKAREIVGEISGMDLFCSVVIPNYLKSEDSRPPDNIAPAMSALSKDVRALVSKDMKIVKKRKLSDESELIIGNSQEATVSDKGFADHCIQISKADTLTKG
jgi:midasin (ATPase involved in ribosome maturation)